MRSTLRRTALAGLVSLLAGCSSAARPRPNQQSSDRPNVPRQAAMLVIENRRPVDFTVFLDNAGQRVRLGMVSGPGVGRFNVPPDLIGGTSPLTIIAMGRAEREPLVDQAVVHPGDTVRFLIDLNDAQVVIDPRR